MAYGVTIPFNDVPLAAQREWVEELQGLGYTDVWSSEADGADAFTPLALAAAWSPGLRLGCAIAPVFTRGPALMAQSAATMAEAAPGRFVLGIGTSSDVIVQRWNSVPFERPYQRTRDMIRFLRVAFRGEKVDEQYETFAVRGFRLTRVPEVAPPIVVAALRPGMLRLAGREADGAITNWLSADDVRKVAPELGPGKELIARIPVCPSEDAETVRAVGRRMIAAYLNVPVYAAFHEWLGRGPVLEDMWAAWRAGDRRGALEAIPDSLVDELILHGSPSQVQAGLQRFRDNGVTTTVLALLAIGIDQRQAVRDLAPGT